MSDWRWWTCRIDESITRRAPRAGCCLARVASTRPGPTSSRARGRIGEQLAEAGAMKRTGSRRCLAQYAGSCASAAVSQGAGDVRQQRDLPGAPARAGHHRGERREHRLHHPGVEGVRGLEARALQLALGEEPVRRASTASPGPGHDAGGRPVDRRERERRPPRRAAAAPPPRAAGPRAWRPAAVSCISWPRAGDQRQRVLQREDARQAGGHVLAEAVADHRRRAGCPTPSRAWRARTRSTNRARAGRTRVSARAARAAAGLPPRARVEHLAQIEAELGLQSMAAQRSTPARNVGSRSYSSRAMPAYCVPRPGNMKTTGRSMALLDRALEDRAGLAGAERRQRLGVLVCRRCRRACAGAGTSCGRPGSVERDVRPADAPGAP